MAALSRDRDSNGIRRPAADLIAAVVANMRQNCEELRYSIVAPSRYTVYLSQSEFARLEGIIPRLQMEAIRALTEELDKLNRPSWLRRKADGWLGKRRPSLENPDVRWHVEFLPDMDGELQHEQDIIVHSELLLPREPEIGGGERTRKITTVHSGQTGTRGRDTTPAAVSAVRPLARLSYTDATGPHTYDIVRDSITIGRGGASHPVDVRVSSSEDVSREHARIQRDGVTGAFFLIDLSSLGTTLNGRHVPRGFDEVNGAKRENGAVSELPARGRIGLAETIFIDFERIGQ